MEFLEYEVTSPALCMGERVKGGIYRPCDGQTIRYSLVTGALRAYTGLDQLHAAGYLIEEEGYNRVESFVYSPRDRVTGVSKAPLTAQFVSNALGRVYVRKGPFTLPEDMTIAMGALKSRGFGRCRLRLRGIVEGRVGRPGLLRTRIPMSLAAEFDIRRIDRPLYGYLFHPTSPAGGVYVLSLFEGSEVVGPDILLKEGGRG